MRIAGRLSAAIEILDDMQSRSQPAASALSHWGRANRYAGSKDRAVIGNLVFDALRNRASLAWRMGARETETAGGRPLVLAALRFVWGFSLEEIEEICDGVKFAPAPLTSEEKAALAADALAGAPAHIQADITEWLYPALEAAFGVRAIAEGQALARRAPVDVRVNLLKSTPEKVAKSLAPMHPSAGRYVSHALRIAHPEKEGRAPHVEANEAHGRGWIEVQDEGSQIAALLAGATPGVQVLDLCAGAGGKTLALAAQMNNKGQIHAYDIDAHRMKPIYERLKRAGVRNCQTIQPGDGEALGKLKGKMDLVLIDAPCSGSGTWRRKPDSKWRLKPEQLEQRCEEQRALLAQARDYVKPGGRLVYVTCSVLLRENAEQVLGFLAENDDFAPVSYREAWAESLGGNVPDSAADTGDFLQLTPASHEVDGFFIALMQRAPVEPKLKS